MLKLLLSELRTNNVTFGVDSSTTPPPPPNLYTIHSHFALRLQLLACNSQGWTVNETVGQTLTEGERGRRPSRGVEYPRV